jgi:hypothetical protein
MTPSTLRRPIVGLLLMLVLVACGGVGAGGGSKLVEYRQVWPDGRTDQETIWTDGRVEMLHGEARERITIPAADVTRITDALAQPIPTGSPDDSPRRTLTLGDGTVIENPRPDPGTATALLESLLNTHRLP